MWSVQKPVRYCLVSLGLLCSYTVFAQEPEHLHFDKIQGEGLTNYSIKCIEQDANGFIWFGTDEGVFKYDGYSFKAFKNFPGDTNSLVNNVIESLYPEHQLIWVGSRGGLSCINIQTNTVKNFPAHEHLLVYSIVPLNDAVFWIGTSTGLYQFNKKKFAWKRMDALDKDVFIRSICDDGKHHLYIASHNGFYRYDMNNGSCKHFLLPPPKIYDGTFQIIHRCILGSDNNIWMTGWHAGLIKYNTDKDSIDEVWTNKPAFATYFKTAFDIVQTDAEHLWIANEAGGLTIVNTQTDSTINYPVIWDDEKKISDAVMALFKDRSGIIWIGTQNGIYKYDPHILHLSKIDFLLNTGTSLTRTQLVPLCMLKDKNGFWWIGTYDGIFLFNTATGLLTNYDAPLGILPSIPVTNIIQDSSGTIWVTAYNKLISVKENMHDKSFSLSAKTYISANIKSVILSIYIDKENRIWLGTHSNGIFRFDALSKQFIFYAYTDAQVASYNNEIRCFYELSADSILTGGETTGLLLLHVNNGKYEKIKWNKNVDVLSDNLTVNQIFYNDDFLWITTDNNGLWQTDKNLKNLTRYTTQDGLPSMNVGPVMRDMRTHLWLLTQGGVVDFQPLNKHIKVYDKKDGIRNTAYNWCMLQDEQGNIAIGDLGSVQLFNPFQIIKNSTPPKVFITSFKVLDSTYSANKKSIKLKYTQNYLSFEYVALNYTQPSLNKYAYMLEGLDKQWINAGSRRYVSYAGLKKGTYTFKVKAANNEGIWSNTVATMSFTITPPFWNKWWFYALVVVLIAAIIYTIYMMRINQWKMKYQLRNKIARDLHDDIGSTLSGINIFTKMALQKIKTDEQASTELLQKISDRSEKTMDALSDIVWSINTKNDTIENVFAKMQEYLSEMLEPRNIKYDFAIDEKLHHVHLNMEQRKELYLIFKEAIHNICKYAQCSFVAISLIRKKDHCILNIHDNGKGFNINKDSSGNGLHNMKQRAEKMNGTIAIESEINKGTNIQLQFDVT